MNTQSPRVEVRNEDLFIYSSTGEITYRGRPDGCPVESAATTTEGRVVSMWKAWSKEYGSKENLLLLEVNGRIVWRAELPRPSNDSYTSFEYSRGRLTGVSWSCYQVEIDLESGRILRREFVK